MTYHVNYFKEKKGQLKIQQMAFVLVALMIFFAMVALFYFSIRIGALRGSVEDLRDQEAKELVRKLAGTSEFTFSSGSGSCAGCIDFDKILMLKERISYEGFWGLDFLEIGKVYPDSEKIECTRVNYPDCNTITLIENENYGAPSDAFVSLCYWEIEKGGYIKCELGRIFASGIKLKE